MSTLVTGATGFVGRRLLRHLDLPIVLSRDARRAEAELAEFHVKAFNWDAENELPPAEAFDGVETVVHLAGEPVAEGRWTKAKKHRLRESRVAGTRNLVMAMSTLSQKPKVLVSASAVGYYGSRGDEQLDAMSTPGDDFLAELCAAWEESSQRATEFGMRVVNPRVGIVLGKGGGALSKMLTPFRFGLGSRLGNGRQWMPWIHLDDLVGEILFAIRHEPIRGPINGSAPNPVTNREFTKTLGSVLRRPTCFPPVPGFMLRLMFGEFGNVLLTSQRALPSTIEAAGYEFQYPTLEEALRSVLIENE